MRREQAIQLSSRSNWRQQALQHIALANLCATRLKNTILYNSSARLHRWRRYSYLISYRKCGRTWLSTVLVHYVGHAKGLITEPLEFTYAPARKYPELLKYGNRVVFLHKFHHPGINPEGSHWAFSRCPYNNKPTGFLVRDPRDVLISLYFHTRSKRGNNSPLDMSPNDFVRNEEFGLPRLIQFYNLQYNYSRTSLGRRVRFYRYEDLRSESDSSVDNWMEMFNYLFQEPINRTSLQWALDVNEFEKLKRREDMASRSLKRAEGEGRVRQGLSGGYKALLYNDTLRYMNDYIEKHLNDFFADYKYRSL